MEPTDESLLDASLNGQPEAFEALLVRYDRKVYGLLWRLCGSTEDAQDLFQTVWMQAYAGRASFKRRSKFSTWLYAIALNHCREWRRKQVQRGLRNGPMPLEVPDPQPSLMDRVLGRDQERRLHLALHCLSPGDRDILSLYYLQEQDYAELAAATGKKIGPLRVQVHRALQRLKTVMGNDEA